VDEGKLAGISTLIARRGQIVHRALFGIADKEAGLPLQEETIFRIYSMTKPIISVAVLMLMEERRLRLLDPIANYLSEFREVKVLETTPGSGGRYVAPERPPTIRGLLTHTAGLSYGNEAGVYIDELYNRIWEKLDANLEMTLAEWSGEIAKLPLVFRPGARFRYSMATDVLGYLVQVVAGQPFEDRIANVV
jgi:CubicO group peptidase (beta-lactamase class C family)